MVDRCPHCGVGLDEAHSLRCPDAPGADDWKDDIRDDAKLEDE